MFFEGQGEVHQTMCRLVERLETANIAHAVVGGMAVNAHRHERTTKDVDVLLTPEGFADFKRQFVPGTYEPVKGRPRRFLDTATGRTLDILVTGKFPGSGKPGPIAYPNPAAVWERINQINYVNLTTLIVLKLAARRPQDFADVIGLISVHGLDESYLTQLPVSVRQDFIECLEEKHRQDEYDSRED
jgi:hypothetical protein